MVNTIGLAHEDGLCIGCGLCAAVCPEQAITMYWGRSLIWVPQIDMTKCTDCGLCVKVCANTPECISEYALAAAATGERFGLQQEAHYFVAYDRDREKRIRSASGGALTAIAAHLLESGELDAVMASVPVMAPVGKLHHEMRLLRSVEELEEARSSHYHPLCYDNTLKEIEDNSGKYGVLGVPCVIRGIERLPKSLRGRIRYTFGLVCSKNVTAQFLDCLARQEGILEGEPFMANQRDKSGGIPDANRFNTYFRLPDREIRRSRFATAWTAMWRNYFFTPQCCLYCPDFYAADADMSVKDAWGHLSKDPLGMSLLIVRNPGLVPVLEELRDCGRLFLQRCDAEEVFQSQTPTPVFKHVEVRDRLVWKGEIRQALINKSYPLGTSRRWWKGASLKYWQFRAKMRLSNFFYSHWKRVPVRGIIAAVHPLRTVTEFIQRRLIFQRYLLSVLISLLRLLIQCIARVRFVCLRPPECAPRSEALRVLISGGYGYRNTGDEAQLGANISRWRRLCPNVDLTILSPNPEYTEHEHGERVELAPRVVFFDSNRRPAYILSNSLFKLEFALLAPLALLDARLLKARLPLIGLAQQQIHLLVLIRDADVLHLSGGGYLTGMTLSRLWDNMLLIRLAAILGTPVVLSGQTIGVFKDRISTKLARWGLRKAELVYVRDPRDSIADLRSIGIQGEHVGATFDDALFCDTATIEEVDDCLLNNEVETGRRYIVVSLWLPGYSAHLIQRMAQVCDHVLNRHDLEILLLPTAPGDVSSLQDLQDQMFAESRIIEYEFDYRIAKGIIAGSKICLTFKHHPIIFAMATGVPTVAIALDDYFTVKNRGALELFGQEQWLVDEKDLLSEGTLEDMIDRCIGDRARISAEIQSYLPAYQEQDGEAIRRFLSNDW